MAMSERVADVVVMLFPEIERAADRMSTNELTELAAHLRDLADDFDLTAANTNTNGGGE